MNEIELIQTLHNRNSAELFYEKYQNAKKDPEQFRIFLKGIDADQCVKNHIIVPEIPATMPDAMRDEYFFATPETGMSIEKHNCFSPVFQHFHTYFECFYVYEGTCVHEITGNVKTLRMGDFCIIPPGVSHSISVLDTSIVINMLISSVVLENTFKNPMYYKSNFLSEFFLKNLHFSNSESYLTIHTGDDRELKDILLQMMIESINKYQEYDAVLSAYFSLFFAKILRYYENTIEVHGRNDKRNQLGFNLSRYIQENHENITLTKTADYFGYTPEYTSRLIKEATGKTFSDILTESRMRHASSLLKATSLTIREISYQVGYENIENFVRMFKKAYNKTPTEYRRGTGF